MAKMTSTTTSSKSPGIVPKDLVSTAPKGLGLKPAAPPWEKEMKRDAFLAQTPEAPFLKAKASLDMRVMKESAEVTTPHLREVLDSNINGSTLREWIDTLPLEDRKEEYRQFAREYLNEMRKPVTSGPERYAVNALLGYGAGDFLGHLLPLASSLITLGSKGKIKPMPPELAPRIRLALGLGGAGAMAAKTPALIRREKSDRIRGEHEARSMLSKSAASKDISKSIQKEVSHGEGSSLELKDVDAARKAIDKAKDAYLQETGGVMTKAYPWFGAAALASTGSQVMAGALPERRQETLKAVADYLIKNKADDIKLVIKKNVDPGVFTFLDGRKMVMKTTPDPAIALHEAGHVVDYVKHPKIMKALKMSAISPTTIARMMLPKGPEQPILIGAGRKFLPRVLRPVSTMPIAAMAGMGLMSENVQKALGDGDTVKYLGEHPELFAAAGSLPLLGVEASATAKAVSELANTKGAVAAIKGGGKLALPYMSYLLGAAATVLGVKSIGDYLEKKRRLKSIKEKAS